MIGDVLIPRALLRDPGTFGGVVEGDCLRGAPVLSGGRLAGLEPPGAAQATAMILPALAEAHCHLDKCHTIHRLGPVGGDLPAAIEAQYADKVNWTEDDLRARVARGLAEAVAAGCAALRTHVDWGDDPAPPTSWHVMTELAQEATIDMQRAALIGVDQWADPDFASAAAAQIAQSEGVLGAFVRGHAEMQDGLRVVFAMAQRHDLMLDFHVDEGLGEFNGLEAIADLALETRFDRPILCGHAVSLMDRAPQDFARIAGKLVQSGIAICALPTTNLYLQGRTDGTPDRRGITRLSELRAAGVPIVIGSDNVGDAFCPTGAHDPMAALDLGVMAAHLDPPLDQWLPAITTDARAAMGLEPLYVDHAPLSALRAVRVGATADLIARRAPLEPFESMRSK